MIKLKKITRRNFIKGSAAAGASLGMCKIGAPALAKTANANDTINVGVIGTGSRGKWLIGEIRKLENTLVTDVCDNFPPHLEEGGESAGSQARKHDNYKNLLAQNEIDAVFIATPLVFHVPMCVDAISEGKHIYCEKSLAYSVEEANQIVKTVNNSQKKFFVGYSRYTNNVAKVKQLINDGAIGKLKHIFTLRHVNTTWERPVPEGYSKRFRHLNWRLYWEYCGGLMTELVSHQINKINWILDSRPLSATGKGSISTYTHHDRETYDNVHVIFDYPDNITVNSSCILTNRHHALTAEFLGTHGTLKTYGWEEGRLWIFWEDENATSHYINYDDITGEHVDTTLGQTLEDKPPDVTNSTGKELFNDKPIINIVEHFFDCIRNDIEPEIGVEEGRISSISVLMANKAMEEGKKVTWEDMNSEPTALEENGSGAIGKGPNSYCLFKNYPNPFNLSTTIEFQIPKREYVEIKVSNLLGREIKRLVERTFDTGRFSVTWNGTDNFGIPVASGIYLCSLKAGVKYSAIKMTLIK